MTPKGDRARRRIAVFMAEFRDENEYWPTVREIGDAVRIKSTSVVEYHLQQMVRYEWVHKTPRVSRGTVLTERGEQIAARFGRGGPQVETCPTCGRRLV